jgi:uroporphyrinogen-III synthase
VTLDLSQRVPPDLRGFTVGVTADRRGEEQAVLLRRLGVDVMAGPAMQTLAVPDGGEALRPQVEAMVEAPPDYLVANTGIGVRNLFALAAQWDLDMALRDALGGVRVVARGPKAAGALRLAGVEVWWRAPGEQLAQVRDRLVAEGVAGSRVVFQLHGDDRQGFAEALRDAGADVTAIEVYRWSLPADLSAARALVEACCAGRVDAVTFTAAPAVRNFLDVADGDGRAGALIDVLNGDVIVGCVGPVCAAAALEEGVMAPVVPEHWRLGSLVKAVGAALEGRRQHLRMAGSGPVGALDGAGVAAAGIDVVVQGSLLVVDGSEVGLDVAERRMARVLAGTPGEWVGAATLVEVLGGASPGGGPGIEAVADGLRAKLGSGASSLISGPQGYRWVATKVVDAASDSAVPL